MFSAKNKHFRVGAILRVRNTKKILQDSKNSQNVDHITHTHGDVKSYLDKFIDK